MRASGEVVSLTGKRCACGKAASYGLPSDRKRLWCGACAKVHGGILLQNHKMCEDCHTKHAHYGLPNEKSKWCSGCGKRHGAVIVYKPKLCEDCKTKRAHYGIESDRKARCTPSHALGLAPYNLVY